MPADSRACPDIEDSSGSAPEVDVWWGACAGRAVLPDFLLSLLITGLIILGAWYLGAWRGATSVRFASQIIIGCLWLTQAARWAYRLVAINYRLTNRRLFCERGFAHPGHPGIELARVRQVVVQRGMWDRLIGTGRIRISLERESGKPIMLDGILRPDLVALKLRTQVEWARQSHQDEAC